MRYCQVFDVRELTRIWRNHAAVIVYYYCCCAADYKTKRFSKSLRTMSNEIGITLSSFRHAVKVLKAAGLLEVQTTGRDTVITIATKFVGEQEFDAIVELRKNSATIARTLGVQEQPLFVHFETFVEVQKLAGRTWHSVRDLCAHFVNWYMKTADNKTVQRAIQATQAAAHADEAAQVHRDERRDSELRQLRYSERTWREYEEQGVEGASEALEQIRKKIAQIEKKQ